MTAPSKTWYVLICRECGDGDDALPMPFETAEERGKWAAEHTRGTGHDRWFVVDQPSTDGPKLVPLLAADGEGPFEYRPPDPDVELPDLSIDFEGPPRFELIGPPGPKRLLQHHCRVCTCRTLVTIAVDENGEIVLGKS